MKKWRTLEEIDALVTGLTQQSRALNLERFTIVNEFLNIQEDALKDWWRDLRWGSCRYWYFGSKHHKTQFLFPSTYKKLCLYFAIKYYVLRLVHTLIILLLSVYDQNINNYFDNHNSLFKNLVCCKESQLILRSWEAWITSLGLT